MDIQDDSKEPNGVAEDDDPRSIVRAARELVPVTSAGVQITNLQQQIDYAQAMAKARFGVPESFRGNVGDCLAIIDISARAGLSPYQVANHCYVQNNRLCFESQLFHAFLQASNLVRGDLDVAYEGEGGDMVCVVTGYLRSDPETARVHRSPPLKDRHPGFVLKKAYDDGSTAKTYFTYVEGEEMRASGKIEKGMKLFSQGSPLWVTKPRVQFFYDTSRDWIRIFAPRATLGMRTPDEMEEFGPEFARDVTPRGSGLGERLRGGEINKDEGHKPGQAAKELGEAKNGNAAAKPAKTDKKAARVKLEAATAPVDNVPPANIAEWKEHAAAWIKAGTDPDAMTDKWRDERKLRNNCGVTQEDRAPLEKLLKERVAELAKAAG